MAGGLAKTLLVLSLPIFSIISLYVYHHRRNKRQSSKRAIEPTDIDSQQQTQQQQESTPSQTFDECFASSSFCNNNSESIQSEMQLLNNKQQSDNGKQSLPNGGKAAAGVVATKGGRSAVPAKTNTDSVDSTAMASVTKTLKETSLNGTSSCLDDKQQLPAAAVAASAVSKTVDQKPLTFAQILERNKKPKPEVNGNVEEKPVAEKVRPDQTNGVKKSDNSKNDAKKRNNDKDGGKRQDGWPRKGSDRHRDRNDRQDIGKEKSSRTDGQVNKDKTKIEKVVVKSDDTVVEKKVIDKKVDDKNVAGDQQQQDSFNSDEISCATKSIENEQPAQEIVLNEEKETIRDKEEEKQAEEEKEVAEVVIVESTDPNLVQQSDPKSSSVPSSTLTESIANQDIKPASSVSVLTQQPQFSDVYSENSSDSGKGSSEIPRNETPCNSSLPIHHQPLQYPISINPVLIGSHMQPPPQSNNPADTTTYKFEIPQAYCGMLIGKKGVYANHIRTTSHANLWIYDHPFSDMFKVCHLIGTQEQINNALQLIRLRFPPSEFPSLPFNQPLKPIQNQISLPFTTSCQLQLPESVVCDVVLSSLIHAAHVFLQQPSHPTYPSLNRLSASMNITYTNTETPAPAGIQPGMVCVAPQQDSWHRVMVIQVLDEGHCMVRLLDYGGFLRVPTASLRQITYEYMSLPFQATECILAGIQPFDLDAGWSEEATAFVKQLADGQILKASIQGYSEMGGTPFINLFKVVGETCVPINSELVKMGFAKWIEYS